MGFDVRALTVDAGVGPEVHEDHLAPQLGQAEQLASGLFSQLTIPAKFGGAPQLTNALESWLMNGLSAPGFGFSGLRTTSPRVGVSSRR